MKKLHPNAIIYFYLLGLLVLIFTLGFFVLVPLFGLAVEGVISFFWSFLFLLVSMVIIFVIPLPWAQLAYKNYRYQLESKVVVIDKGVIWKKHVSIPYERVQNIDIVKGPFARMLGFAGLHIQTAGISGAALIEGRIPAVDPKEAVKIKDQILSKVTKSKDQGL